MVTGPTIPDLATHLPDDVRDAASRLISYREELNGRLFTATRSLAKYCFVVTALGAIGLLSGNLLYIGWLVWLLKEVLVWVQNLSTLILSIVFLFVSLTSIVFLHKRMSPYEKKLEDDGYLLVKAGRSENWIINKSSGKAERLLYIEPYTFRQWWRANKKNSQQLQVHGKQVVVRQQRFAFWQLRSGRSRLDGGVP